MTKFLNISTDNTLGGNSPSNEVVSSQKAVKEYVDSQGGGGGGTAIDNLSITRNSSLQIQTVGVINQNATTTALKQWSGTRAQYNAIVTKDPNTLYNITDDTDVSLTILEALYPIGSVYITTANTCPLSTLISGSTWTQETSRILVEKKAPDSSDNRWYNLYSDGWCEQGGSVDSGEGSITFLKQFSNTNYYANIIQISDSSGSSYAYASRIKSKSASSMNYYINYSNGNWHACGYTSTT